MRENIVFARSYVAQDNNDGGRRVPRRFREFRLALHHNAIAPPVFDAHRGASIDNGRVLNVKLSQAMGFAIYPPLEAATLRPQSSVS